MMGIQFFARPSVSFLVFLALGSISSLRADPRRAPVPATLEIEILDPGVDPLGNPTVVIGPSTPDGRQVDIPPTVLVHKYYYTGNRHFQGPLLPGGPSVVVVTHPDTHERLYVDVNLLPGAPRICYTPSCIEYDYGNRGIKLIFQHRGQVDVAYRNCVPPQRVIGKGVAGIAKGGVAVLQRSGAVHVVQGTGVAVAGATGIALDGVREGGKIILTPVVNVAQTLPIVNPIVSSLRDRTEGESRNAIRRRDAELIRAQRRLDTLDNTIPTIR